MYIKNSDKNKLNGIKSNKIKKNLKKIHQKFTYEQRMKNKLKNGKKTYTI